MAAVVVAIAAVIACSSEEPAEEGAGDDVATLRLGDTLMGGHTYRFPDGSWLIDVPEGMRLRYGYTTEGPTGIQHGLIDPLTGSGIGIRASTGEILRSGEGDSPEEVRAAEARLDLIEASFRRPPDYVPPLGTSAQRAPELNASGVQIMEWNDVLEGGRRYAFPHPHDALVIEIPAGLTVEFSVSFTVDGTRYYWFEGDDWSVSVNTFSGTVLGTEGGGTTAAAVEQLKAALTRLFESVSASD